MKILILSSFLLSGCLTGETLEDMDRFGMAKGAQGGASAIQQPFTGRLDTSACGWGESGEPLQGSLNVTYTNDNCQLQRRIP